MPVIDVMKVIDKAGTQFVVIVENGILLGSLTDGDIRRGILRNIPLTAPVKEVMNKSPLTLPETTSSKDALVFLHENKITHVPLVDNKGTVKSIVGLEDELTRFERPNTAVLMVGGLGRRLGDLTTNCPKPMLKVRGKPVLEIILENLRDHGFVNFVFCVNYRAEMIQSYFKDGSDFGVNIEYVQEPKRMGTAGALALLPETICGPLLVMNGDIITKVNFTQLLDFHLKNNASASMGVRKFDFQIPYGVVKTEDGCISGIEEKPVHSFLVSAGIYVVEKPCLKLIPPSEFFDMPQLFEKLIEQREKTQAFPIHEYWLDIGREDDLARAQEEYHGESQ